MSAEEEDTLPSEVEALLRTERARPALPAEQSARIVARSRAAVATGLGAATGSTASTRFGKVAWVLGSFAVGIGVGAGVTLLAMDTANGSEQPVESTPSAPPSGSMPTLELPLDAAPAPAPEPPAEEAAPSEVADRESPGEDRTERSPNARGARARSSPTGDESLRDERLLIDAARSAIARGAAADALAALEEHDRLHRGGRLTEDALALRIMALAALGRATEAQTLGDEFLRRYPQSLYRARVEQSSRSEP